MTTRRLVSLLLLLVLLADLGQPVVGIALAEAMTSTDGFGPPEMSPQASPPTLALIAPDGPQPTTGVIDTEVTIAGATDLGPFYFMARSDIQALEAVNNTDPGHPIKLGPPHGPAVSFALPYTPSIRTTAPITTAPHILLPEAATDMRAFRGPVSSPDSQGDVQLPVETAVTDTIPTQVAAIVTVDTTSMVIDGAITNTTTLLTDPGPDQEISFAEALAAVNNTGPGQTVKFNLPHGSVIEFGTTLRLYASNTVIDGDADGNGTPDVALTWPLDDWVTLQILSDNNVIRNLVLSDIDLNGAACHSNLVTASYIGTDVEGRLADPKLSPGVVIRNGAHHNIIENNKVAGRWDRVGVQLQSNAHDNEIRGNWIGVNVDGDSLANEIGIWVGEGATGNIIGGERASVACDSPCNVISGNTNNGIVLADTGTTRNVIQGNYIGVNPAGIQTLANDSSGVVVRNGATQNTIGGDTRAGQTCDGPCNVISGNSAHGVLIYNTGTISNEVQGNFIGLNPDGTGEMANQFQGVLITLGAARNLIGGKHALSACHGPCNLVGGNGQFGIVVHDTGTISNTVQGNYVGLNRFGTGAVPNVMSGIAVLAGASGNTVGGKRTASFCGGPCNVVSGNGESGVLLANSGTISNVVEGNFVGLDPFGTAALPNQVGVALLGGAAQNLIGGERTSADCDGPCNVVGGNREAGVLLRDSGTISNTVQGNYVGLNPLGTEPISNTLSGVEISNGATQNTVGGWRPSTECTGPCNVISGGGENGVGLTGTGTTKNIVQGNYIGLNPLGTTSMPNTLSGVAVANGATENTIGGERPLVDCTGPCNVISGNSRNGVRILDSGTISNTVQGNYIGLNSDGTTALPNDFAGVSLINGPSHNIIGGERDDSRCAGPCNLISGNSSDGVLLIGAGTKHNRVQGNYVGANPTLTDSIPNELAGVALADGVSQNIIGREPSEDIINDGSFALIACDGPCNFITGNAADGVSVIGETTLGNTIRGNSIFDNGRLGIDLSGDGVSRNDPGDADAGPNGGMNHPMGVTAVYDLGTDETTVSGRLDTQNPTASKVDVYANDSIDPSGYGEGQIYLGQATPDDDGHFELILPGQLVGRFLSATATDADGSTSEFGPRPPLVFIPGNAGNLLIDAQDGVQLWPPLDIEGWPGWKKRMSLYSNDIPSKKIYAEDVIYTALGARYKVYNDLLESLTSQSGYRSYELKFDLSQQPPSIICDYENQKDNHPNLFVFPYDFRKSDVDATAKLRDFIDCIQQFYPGSQVDILAHSAGTVLARRYIMDDADHKVNKLISSGAPWLGAPKMIHVLTTGDFFDLTKNHTGKVGIFVEIPTLKYLAGSFTGLHELLPAQAYYDLAGMEAPLFEDGWDLNGDHKQSRQEYTYQEYIDVLDMYGKDNSVPYDPGTTADTFHRGLQDDWRNDTSGVYYYHLYGVQSGKQTIGRLAAIYSTPCAPQPPPADLMCFPKPVFGISKYLTRGDGTVPQLSIEKIGNGQSYNGLNTQFKAFYAFSYGGDDEVSHTGLTHNASFLDTVLVILTEGRIPETPSPITLGLAPPATADAPPPVQPYYYLTINGGTSVVISDSLGNSTTPISETLRGIVPGVSTHLLGDNVWMHILSPGGNYTVTFQTLVEPLAIELTLGTGDTATEAIRYMDLSLPQGVKAMLKITDQGADMLRYDSDGDGTFETSVTPTVDVSGPQANDLEPPVILVQTVEQQDSVKITLSAQDSGSGVKALYYSLDGSNFQLYTTQLQVDPTPIPILYAFADDNVENRATLVYPLSSVAEDHPIYLPVILKNR